MSAFSDPFSSPLLVQKNIDLSEMNTLGIKAVASTFIDLKHRNHLVKLNEEGFFDEFSPLILGGGSNILIRKDPEVPVLKVSTKGIEIVQEKGSTVLVRASAGVVWHDLVSWAVEKGLGGIENLALIPGTVGAAPIQNIGAYGIELNQVFEKLTAFDISAGKFVIYKKSDCDFGYRDSIFKRKLKGKIIVTDVTLQLQKESFYQVNDSYYALQDYLKSNNILSPSVKDIYEAVINIRRSKLPDPKLLGNAGSFFKNPFITQKTLARLQQASPKIPFYPADNELVKIPAGWLIEQAGWKGKRFGNVGTYKNQALVIVNFGGATGQEVFSHARKIQASVQEKFGIELTPEVNIVE